MDENNLDGLLDELESSDEELNDNLDLDSGVDIDLSDMDGISLEELDNLDGLDLGDLDFDDIDFDDVDITNLDAGQSPRVSRTSSKEDMNLDSLIEEANEQQLHAVQEDVDDEVFLEAEQQAKEEEEMAAIFDDADFEGVTAETMSAQELEEALNPPDMAELGIEEPATAEPENGEPENGEPENGEPETDLSEELPADDISVDTLSSDPELPEDLDLDSLLNSMESMENEDENPYTAGEDSLDALLQASMEMSMESGDLADIEDISEAKGKAKKVKTKKKKEKGEEKKKRSFSEILFGEPDEEDIEEAEYLEKKKAEKAEKKEKKKAEKEVKQAEKEEAKQEQLEKKKKEDSKKQQAKAEKKAAKDAEYQAELDAEKDAKKVPNAVVVIVFAIFAALGVFVVLGSKNFSYGQMIKKASDYFNRKRYHLAYDEVAGVEVKEKDQELKDKIYTVMYVERLYESYENNVALNRMDKALDALLRGIQKYDEHYEEAVELGIVEDIDGCRAKIVNALWNDYGITEETAYAILALDGKTYTETLAELSKVDKGE